MTTMDSWDPDEGSFGTFKFDDSDISTFFDISGELSFGQRTPGTTLNTFDFGLPTGQESNSGSNYYSVSSTSGQGQGQLSNTTMQNRRTYAQLNPAPNTSILPPSGFQFQNGPPFSHAPRNEHTHPMASNGNASEDNSNLERPLATYPDENTQTRKSDFPEGDSEPAPPVPPKVRRTRKKKYVSPEEERSKKEAFLSRNRDAARKCRAKRKVDQSKIHENAQNLTRENAELKAINASLAATRLEILDALTPHDKEPGLLNELKSIQSGHALRPAMFSFENEVSIVPIGAPINSSLSFEGSRAQTLNQIGFIGHQDAPMYEMEEDDDEAESESRRDSNDSQQLDPQFFNFMNLNSPPASSAPASNNGVNPYGSETQPSSRHMSREPGLHTNTQSQSSMQPSHQKCWSDLNISTPSMGRSASQGSAYDSGLGNVSPTTPTKRRASGPPDEGVVVNGPVEPSIFHVNPFRGAMSVWVVAPGTSMPCLRYVHPRDYEGGDDKKMMIKSIEGMEGEGTVVCG